MIGRHVQRGQTPAALRLPGIRRGNRMLAIGIGYLGFSVVYLVAGFVQLHPVTLLNPTVIDRSIPYLEWSIWLYVTQFPFLFLSIWLFNDDVKRSHTYYAMLLATLLAATIFMAWPTTVARHAHGTAGATALAWRLLYAVDTPANCFPSLHVALACLAAAAMYPEGSRWRLIAPLWATVIASSTLTTKQHYMSDVLGGFLLAGFCYAMTRRFVRYGG